MSPGVVAIDSAEVGEQSVELLDGPFKGLRVNVVWGRAVLMQREGDPTRVARYRPRRDRTGYRFRGWDQVVHRIEVAQ